MTQCQFNPTKRRAREREKKGKREIVAKNQDGVWIEWKYSSQWKMSSYKHLWKYQMSH